jgi:hypothetical protein
VLLNGVSDFSTTAIGNLWRGACHGGTIGHNAMFIWRTFGFLPYSVIESTMLDLRVGIKFFICFLHLVPPNEEHDICICRVKRSKFPRFLSLQHRRSAKKTSFLYIFVAVDLYHW